jgi:hypothetical protein
MSRCLHQTTPADRVNQVREINKGKRFKGKGYNLQKTGLSQSPVFFDINMSLRGGQKIDRRSNPDVWNLLTNKMAGLLRFARNDMVLWLDCFATDRNDITHVVARRSKD